jgi:hypothetical protein
MPDMSYIADSNADAIRTNSVMVDNMELGIKEQLAIIDATMESHQRIQEC